MLFRSGLPRAAGTARYPYRVAEMHADLAKVTLARAPGTKWEYSNLGIALLAEAMETIFKAPIDKLIAEHVSTPLGLTDTGLVGSGTDALVTGYLASGVKAPLQSPTWPAYQGAGALWSTAADLGA